MAAMGASSWISENPQVLQPITSVQKPQPTYRPRKSHTKSRKGCQNCRRRKIKCDEARPSCGQCQDRLLGSVQCDFSILKKPAVKDLDPSLEYASRISTSCSSNRDRLAPYLENAGISCRLTGLDHKRGDPIELLDHFVSTTTLWVGSPLFQQIIQDHGLELCLNAPYLMHAILAFSASHLAHVLPEETAYSLAFTRHYSISLWSYSAQLQMTLDTTNADAIIASSHFQSMLAFGNAKSEDTVNGDEGFTWLRAMRGVSVLWNIKDIYSHLKAGVWREMESESRVLDKITCEPMDSNEADSWAFQTSKALHMLFKSLCDPDTYRASYKKPLDRLCLLIRCDLGSDSICAFMAFVGQLPSSFLQLLDAQDAGAMLILCYWSALLIDLDQWWIVGSAMDVCKRLCAHLDMVHGRRIRDFLHFPASKCGYVMGD